MELHKTKWLLHHHEILPTMHVINSHNKLQWKNFDLNYLIIEKTTQKEWGATHYAHKFLCTWPPPHNHYEWILKHTLFDKDNISYVHHLLVLTKCYNTTKHFNIQQKSNASNSLS